MRVTLVLTSLLILTQSSAHAGVREDVAGKKFICGQAKDLVTWLAFSKDAKRVFFYNYNAEHIKMKWEGDRVSIESLFSQDRPLYFEAKDVATFTSIRRVARSTHCRSSRSRKTDFSTDWVVSGRFDQ